ncbi:MAG TPA: RNA ligase [Polyangiaceae bacterium]|nr:RNA ligase [Polyangiaceae bacterium]
MPTLAVFEALAAEGLEALAARLGLQVRRHREHPQLALLKYSTIDSPLGDPVVRQCRGIVVDEADGFRPVAYPFDKFFNYHEGHAAPIDWASARVFDKADGILCTLYAYRGRWHVASASLPDAQGALRGAGRSVAESFWGVFRDRGYAEPDRADHCFMFELCLPSDPVLVRHAEPRLLLHGARDLASFAEVEHEPFAARYGWQAVASRPARSLDEAVRAARALDPVAAEGFVVRDGGFRRAKIKSPAYVALHHMRGATNLRHVLEIVRANEGDEFLAYFPDARPAWHAVRERFEALRREAEAALAAGEGLDDRAFGLSVRHLPYGSMLFAVRKGLAPSLGEALASGPVQKLERHLGLAELARQLGLPLEPRARGAAED